MLTLCGSGCMSVELLEALSRERQATDRMVYELTQALRLTLRANTARALRAAERRVRAAALGGRELDLLRGRTNREAGRAPQ